MNIGLAGEQAVDRFLDPGIEVDRVDELSLWELLGQQADGLADILKPITEVLSAMARDQDHRLFTQHGVLVLPGARVGGFLVNGPEQGIYDRIADNPHLVSWVPFGEQGRGRSLGGGAME